MSLDSASAILNPSPATRHPGPCRARSEARLGQERQRQQATGGWMRGWVVGWIGSMWLEGREGGREGCGGEGCVCMSLDSASAILNLPCDSTSGSFIEQYQTAPRWPSAGLSETKPSWTASSLRAHLRARCEPA